MPPKGFYDATDDVYGPVEQPKFPTSIEELEGKRSASSAILQANKLNSVISVRKGSKLTLSAPQISDDELGQIAKMGGASWDQFNVNNHREQKIILKLNAITKNLYRNFFYFFSV